MDIGLIDLPQSKWGSGTGRQAILKGDFAKIEAAVLQSFGLQGSPALSWVDNTSIKVPATPDDIAAVMMSGFPSVIHPKRFVSAGLSDGRYRENTADVIMDFDLANNFWSTEKINQWYSVYAMAGNAATAFTLKGLPYMWLKSQASQVISLGNPANPATGIGYGLATNEFAGGGLYCLSGSSKGLIRSITANNNDNGTGGTITYGGSTLTLAQGDCFIVLPPATNFRYLGDIFNNSSSNIRGFFQEGNLFFTDAIIAASSSLGVQRDITLCSPMATEMFVSPYQETGEAPAAGTAYSRLYFTDGNIKRTIKWGHADIGAGVWYFLAYYNINAPLIAPCTYNAASSSSSFTALNFTSEGYKLPL